MIKLAAIYMIIYTLLGSIVLMLFADRETAISCAIGGFIMLINLIGIYLLWQVVFTKKSIALAVVIIILKYLILGFVLWYLAQVSYIRPIGLVVGLSTLVLAILSTTLTKSFVKNNEIK
ncbi:MAG: hypothetical protein WA160_07835 [Pseudobdellovibrio sp.]